tara:strand:- start:256 stop:441 length:186 start_codon:yes stop_codon:yes gene_type:complete
MRSCPGLIAGEDGNELELRINEYVLSAQTSSSKKIQIGDFGICYGQPPLVTIEATWGLSFG